MNQISDMTGNLRKPGPAKSKETVYYDFNRENAPFILDIINAFGIASQQHNEDIRQIIGKILETAASR
jgi:hypothetical protein